MEENMDMDCSFQGEEEVRTILNIENIKRIIPGASIPCTFNHNYHTKFHPCIRIFDVVDCTNGSIRRHYTEKKVARGRKEEQKS